MTSRAYYNENDPAAAHILKEMIARNVVAPGDVDTRSIKDVKPDDLKPYSQCHFFAGGGLWSVAARLAGWPDERPLWTGSCPCQPFSTAGKGQGTDDSRHLWPDVYRLIRARRPVVVMGEQVAGAPGYGWFDRVRTDLEGEGYASRAVDFPACSVDAPHQRNRLYWLSERLPVAANDNSKDRHGDLANDEGGQCWTRLCQTEAKRDGHFAANSNGIGRQSGTVGNAIGAGLEGHGGNGASGEPRSQSPGSIAPANDGYWSDAEWINCHDGKRRRTKPGLRLLVNGLPGRIHLWRVGGNAIVPAQAAEVIASYLETSL